MGGYDFSGRSQSEAWAWCWLASITFVVGLYLVPARLRRLPRSDPSQIKARLVAVCSTTSLSVLVTHSLARPVQDGLPVRRWIGLGTDRLGIALLLPLLLVCCLFLGPLVTMACMARKLSRNELSANGQSRIRTQPLPWYTAAGTELAIKANLMTGALSAIRNLVGERYQTAKKWEWSFHGSLKTFKHPRQVGPIAEEVVFRGCFVPVLLGAGVSRTKITWLSPLLFGFAHLHHALEWLRQGQPVPMVVASVLFQIAYTTVFGAFAMYVHLRTGHLFSSILVHMLCNFMGVPDVTFSISPGNHRESTRVSALYEHRRGIWCCYGLGICLFCGLLRPLTAPSLYDSVLWSPGISDS